MPELRGQTGAEQKPGYHPGLESKAGKEKRFMITFPDGTIGSFDSTEEAIEAMRVWREH